MCLENSASVMLHQADKGAMRSGSCSALQAWQAWTSSTPTKLPVGRVAITFFRYEAIACAAAWLSATLATSFGKLTDRQEARRPCCHAEVIHQLMQSVAYCEHLQPQLGTLQCPRQSSKSSAAPLLLRQMCRLHCLSPGQSGVFSSLSRSCPVKLCPCVFVAMQLERPSSWLLPVPQARLVTHHSHAPKTWSPLSIPYLTLWFLLLLELPRELIKHVLKACSQL